MKQKYKLKDFTKLSIKLNKQFIIYLKADLGAGKTTLSKYILNNILYVKQDVISPTYTYYNKYSGVLNGENIEIYHFDLYRLKDYDEFFAIAGEDIFDNNNGIILVEWPEIIEKYYKSDLDIILKKTDIEDEREIEINYK